jgi:hypothetical protein
MKVQAMTTYTNMNRISFLLIIVLAAVACKKENVKVKDISGLSPNLTARVDDYIKNAQLHPCDGYSVLEYRLNNRSVFVFTSPYCVQDGAAQVVDETSSNICLLGGLAGDVTCEGIKFDSAAKFVRTIWQP